MSFVFTVHKSLEIYFFLSNMTYNFYFQIWKVPSSRNWLILERLLSIIQGIFYSDLHRSTFTQSLLRYHCWCHCQDEGTPENVIREWTLKHSKNNIRIFAWSIITVIKPRDYYWVCAQNIYKKRALYFLACFTTRFLMICGFFIFQKQAIDIILIFLLYFQLLACILNESVVEFKSSTLFGFS